jgi:hypothetical protein
MGAMARHGLVDGLGPGHLVPRFWMISCITRPFSILIL